MKTIMKHRAELISLGSELLAFEKKIEKQKSATEEKIWEHVVGTYPNELGVWIEENLFEAINIVSKADALSNNLCSEPWIIESYNDGEFCYAPGWEKCKYIKALTFLELGDRCSAEIIKVKHDEGSSLRFVKTINIKTSAGDHKLNYLDFDKSTNYPEYRAKLRSGTKPLVEFIRSIVDPMVDQINESELRLQEEEKMDPLLRASLSTMNYLFLQEVFREKLLPELTDGCDEALDLGGMMQEELSNFIEKLDSFSVERSPVGNEVCDILGFELREGDYLLKSSLEDVSQKFKKAFMAITGNTCENAYNIYMREAKKGLKELSRASASNSDKSATSWGLEVGMIKKGSEIALGDDAGIIDEFSYQIVSREKEESNQYYTIECVQTGETWEGIPANLLE